MTYVQRMRLLMASSTCAELSILLLHEAGTDGASAGEAQVMPIAAGSRILAARCHCARGNFLFALVARIAPLRCRRLSERVYGCEPLQHGRRNRR